MPRLRSTNNPTSYNSAGSAFPSGPNRDLFPVQAATGPGILPNLVNAKANPNTTHSKLVKLGAQPMVPTAASGIVVNTTILNPSSSNNALPGGMGTGVVDATGTLVDMMSGSGVVLAAPSGGGGGGGSGGGAAAVGGTSGGGGGGGTVSGIIQVGTTVSGSGGGDKRGGAGGGGGGGGEESYNDDVEPVEDFNYRVDTDGGVGRGSGSGAVMTAAAMLSADADADRQGLPLQQQQVPHVVASTRNSPVPDSGGSKGHRLAPTAATQSPPNSPVPGNAPFRLATGMHVVSSSPTASGSGGAAVTAGGTQANPLLSVSHSQPILQQVHQLNVQQENNTYFRDLEEYVLIYIISFIFRPPHPFFCLFFYFIALLLTGVLPEGGDLIIVAR
jgi:hypothetical protein